MGVTKHIFSEVLTENPDGTLSPRRTISVNGVKFNENVTFAPGVAFGGIDFHKYKNLLIAGSVNENNVLVILGFYDK